MLFIAITLHLSETAHSPFVGAALRKETHRRIVKAIAQELGLSGDQRRVLVRVVSNFDSIDRKRRKSKRHHGYSACYRAEDSKNLRIIDG